MTVFRKMFIPLSQQPHPASLAAHVAYGVVAVVVVAVAVVVTRVQHVLTKQSNT